MDKKKSSGLGFCDVLLVVFIVLEVIGVINWSWCWVLALLCIPLLLVAVVVLIDCITD